MGGKLTENAFVKEIDGEIQDLKTDEKKEADYMTFQMMMNEEREEGFAEGMEMNMEQVMVNFRMDAALKRDVEAICKEMGMSLTTAFTIFAKKLSRERKIPFEVSADPFYSESNLRHLRRGVAALNAGEGQEHELIEADA